MLTCSWAHVKKIDKSIHITYDIYIGNYHEVHTYESKQSSIPWVLQYKIPLSKRDYQRPS